MLKNRNIAIIVEESAKDQLMELCRTTCKDKGGRGIENVIESALINPLARYMYDNCIGSGTISVVSIQTDQCGGHSQLCNVF